MAQTHRHNHGHCDSMTNSAQWGRVGENPAYGRQRISWPMRIVMWPEGQWEASKKTALDGAHRHLHRRTWRLYDQLGPVGPSWWKSPIPTLFFWSIKENSAHETTLGKVLKKKITCYLNYDLIKLRPTCHPLWWQGLNLNDMSRFSAKKNWIRRAYHLHKLIQTKRTLRGELSKPRQIGPCGTLHGF